MHGVDWKAMRERYGRLLADAVTRWDVNYILGELLGELNVSHAYRSGGDLASRLQPLRGISRMRLCARSGRATGSCGFSKTRRGSSRPFAVASARGSR